MSKPTTLRDVDETELYLNHGGNSVWSRWWKVGGGFLTFAIWLFVEAGPEATLYLRRHPWLLAFGLLSLATLLYGETLRYDLPNHYMKDGLQYFDQAAIGKRRLQRRLLRLPALLFAFYSAYIFIPWNNYQDEVLSTNLKYWLLLPAVGVLVYLYYIAKGYFAAYEATSVAKKYGDLTARFDRESYAPGDAVNVVIGHNRAQTDRTAVYDVVVQKVFEHQYTKTTGSGDDRETTTHHERKVPYTRSFQVTGGELNDGWCFDLPEHIGGHTMDTDMRDVEKLHYWELLLDKRDSALWGRFFIMVEGGPEARQVAGTEWMPAMDESVYDEGEGYKESVFGDSPEAISISGKDSWPVVLFGLMSLLMAGGLSYLTYKSYTGGSAHPLQVLMLISMSSLFYLPSLFATYTLTRSRPRPGKVQRRSDWYPAVWRVVVAVGVLPTVVTWVGGAYMAIQLWAGDDTLKNSDIVGVAFGLLIMGAMTGYGFYRATEVAVRKFRQARRAGVTTATFSAASYAPGGEVLVRVEGQPPIDPAAEATLYLRLVDESLPAKRNKRFILFYRHWKVNGGKLGDGVRFSLPAKVKGYHLESEYRGFREPKYWELGVDFGGGRFHQFIITVEGQPAEVEARPPVQSEVVKAAPDAELDWFA